VELLGGQQRKTPGERKAGLRAEHGVGARAGAVGLEFAPLKHEAKQVEVLSHRGKDFNHETHETHEKKFGRGLDVKRFSRARSVPAGLEFKLQLVREHAEA